MVPAPVVRGIVGQRRGVGLRRRGGRGLGGRRRVVVIRLGRVGRGVGVVRRVPGAVLRLGRRLRVGRGGGWLRVGRGGGRLFGVAAAERVGRRRGVAPRRCPRRRCVGGGWIGVGAGGRVVLVLIVVAGGGGGSVVAAPVLHLRWLIGRGLGFGNGDADADDEGDGEFDSIRWVAFAFLARGKEGGKKTVGLLREGEDGGVASGGGG